MSKTITLCSKEKSYSNVLWPARMTKSDYAQRWAGSGRVGLEDFCHHALHHCKLVAPRAFKTGDHPSSDEMWRWHAEKPVSPVVTQSSRNIPRKGYQCSCLCLHEWLWLMCFRAATSPLPMLCAGMMEWKGLVCIVLHLASCWQCRDVTGQLSFTASAGCSPLLSHCRCDTGKELGKYLLGALSLMFKRLSPVTVFGPSHTHHTAAWDLSKFPVLSWCTSSRYQVLQKPGGTC